MILFKIAARNVLRNKRRSAITFIGIGMGLMMIIIFQGMIGGMDKQITDNFIRAQAGHIRVYAPGYKEEARLFPLDRAIEEPRELIPLIRAVPGVVGVAERIRFGAMVSTGKKSLSALGLAIEPEEERRAGIIAESIVQGSYLTEEPGYVLIGNQLAEDLHLQVGSILYLVATTAQGAMNAIDAEIKGIFHTGYSQYDSMAVVLPLQDAQRLLGMKEAVTELAVTLADIDLTDRAAALLEERLGGEAEVETWKESGAAIWQLLLLRRQILGIISFIVIAIASLGIVNTMLMSVFERVREIGTMMALGVTRREILLLFLAESMLLGAAGGALGGLIGGGLVKYFSIVGISPPSSISALTSLPIGTTFYADFSWKWILVFFALAQVVAILAALYPASIASRQEPVEALRHI